jgi:hypothetical protein
MRFKIALLGLAAAALVPFGPASANLAELLGNWHNVNAATRDIVRVEIMHVGGAIEVHAWGACTPTPCDIGTAKAMPYAPNVGAPLPQDAQYLQVEYKKSFEVMTLVIGPSPNPGGELHVVSLTQFTDNSGRSNHAMSDMFKK